MNINMELSCPLTGSSKIVLIENINANFLIKRYKKRFNCDISSELKNIKEIGFYHSCDSDLRFFYPMVTGSELLYEKLQNFDWYYQEEKEEYEYACQYIKESDLVLEIGCGKGAFSEKITCQKYIGLEYSQKAKTLASNNITILNEFVQEHSINNSENYTVVLGFQVLEHVAEIHSFIEASLNCLKPGGLLIFSVPSADSFVSCLKNNTLNMPPHHVSWWSDKSLRYVAQIFGLKILDIHHEKLAEIHRRWYASSILLQALEKTIGYDSKNQLIDRSLTYKILSKISVWGARWLARGIRDPRFLPNGHSVTVVYQKQV